MAAVGRVHCADAVADYVLDVVDATHTHPDVVLGASSRAAIGLLAAARARATVVGRDFTTPDDVKAVAAHALAHRLVLADGPDLATGSRVVADVLAAVSPPVP